MWAWRPWVKNGWRLDKYWAQSSMYLDLLLHFSVSFLLPSEPRHCNAQVSHLAPVWLFSHFSLAYVLSTDIKCNIVYFWRPTSLHLQWNCEVEEFMSALLAHCMTRQDFNRTRTQPECQWPVWDNVCTRCATCQILRNTLFIHFSGNTQPSKMQML